MSIAPYRVAGVTALIERISGPLSNARKIMVGGAGLEPATSTV
jgi:hypothetical protein